MRGRRLPGAAPQATPVGASQETRNKGRELGREAGQRRLSLVPASTPPPSTSPGTATASMPTGSHQVRSPASSSPCARAARVPPTSSTTGLRSTSPGPWARRPSDGRSRWRTCSGSAARATGARPGSIASWPGSCRRVRWTGGEPVRSCGSIARGPVCFLPRSGLLTPASAGSCPRTSAPRHRGYEADGNPLSRHRDGPDCVFHSRQGPGGQVALRNRLYGLPVDTFSVRSA